MGEEELTKVIKKLLASGITMKSIQKKMGEESKQEKSKQQTLSKGKSRGGGKAKGKSNYAENCDMEFVPRTFPYKKLRQNTTI
jgi:hypothetical protein